jgi:hypothetical protein
MATKEANTSGGSLESGCCYKQTAKDERSMKHGNEQSQKPQSPPVTSAPNGHKIK